MNPKEKYPAFCKWLEMNSKNDTIICSGILFQTLESNPKKDNMVWEFIEATGDKEYTSGTFIRAAEIALGKRSA